MSKLVVSCCCAIAVLCSGADVFALPPLGLTQISPMPVSLSNLELIGNSAYLGVPGGAWSVDSSGNKVFVPLSHPTLGIPDRVTRVVDGPDGRLYAGGSYGSFSSGFDGSALFALESPTNPLTTWEYVDIRGVDRGLRGLGNMYDDYPNFEVAAEFLLDGTVMALPKPPPSEEGIEADGGAIIFTSRNGYAIGVVAIPGTLGLAGALWTPSGEFSFVYFVAHSVRDRLDGQGINIGLSFFNADVNYANGLFVTVLSESGSDFSLFPNVIVSHSDFVVIDESSTSHSGLHGFYPGIIPDHPDRALPLLDIFPELASIDINEITDLASVDGYIYMTLSGSDGLYLFGARDPSVIPEPTTLILAAMGLAVGLALRRKSRRIFLTGQMSFSKPQ